MTRLVCGLWYSIQGICRCPLIRFWPNVDAMFKVSFGQIQISSRPFSVILVSISFIQFGSPKFCIPFLRNFQENATTALHRVVNHSYDIPN